MNLNRRQFIISALLALPTIKLLRSLPKSLPAPAIEAEVVAAPAVVSEGAFVAEARRMTSAAIVAILKELYDEDPEVIMKGLVYNSSPFDALNYAEK